MALLTVESYEIPDVVVELDVRAALEQLPPGQRDCVKMRYLFELSPEEVSQQMGISPGTVKSQTARGLRQLRDILRLRALTGG